MKKLTQAEFLAKALAVHGNRYDYSQALYVGGKSMVKIGCPTHGVFEQTGSAHIMGRGCVRCGVATRAQSHRHDTAQFIAQAQAIHGEQYDYSITAYVSVLEPVKIICPQHGQFEQTPTSHTSGNGCSKCHRQKMSAAYSDDTNGFILKAQQVHGDIYNYSAVEYVNNSKKVKIICPQHGQFEQTPGNHKSGMGCPACGYTLRDEKTRCRNRASWAEYINGQPSTLYFIRLFDESESFFKIGVTYQSVRARYKCKGRRGEYNYELLASYSSSNSAAVAEWEQSIIETFSHISYKPKKYFGGHSECFSSCEEILNIFPL